MDVGRTAMVEYVLEGMGVLAKVGNRLARKEEG